MNIATGEVITDTRKRAVASIRSVLPLRTGHETQDWHCRGSASDPHEPVQWHGTEHCWHCGQTGTPGRAEAA